MSQNDQQELFKAEASWFHVFKNMIVSGDVAKLGTPATVVYLVIKAYSNYSTGLAFPGTELIAEKAGLSERHVIRSLKTLEEAGYLTKKRRGRSNLYTLREKVEIQDTTGRPSAVATWDYLPSTVKAAQAEIRNLVLTGSDKDLSIIHIERLSIGQINIQAGEHNHQTNINLDQVKDPVLREQIRKLVEKDRAAPVDNPEKPPCG